MCGFPDAPAGPPPLPKDVPPFQLAQYNAFTWYGRFGWTNCAFVDMGDGVLVYFGYPTAHEDDAQRAVSAALELRQIPKHLNYIQSLQMGTSLGTLRVGAYGNATRQTYAALGDDVNLAARLMTTARPDEILITGRVQIDIAHTFALEPREPIPMKGKGEPQSVFAVTGVERQRATRLPEPAYRLPMVGRQQELRQIDEKLKLALEGKTNGGSDLLSASLLPQFEDHLRQFLYQEKGRVLLISCLSGALKALAPRGVWVRIPPRARSFEI